mmetsp:Transcript_21435/g.55711  ORF Transcript_21435/g.55711 Transcript_21435/m.55711 type:complete len:84 (-) Transcript_21435:1362-1613(-)
MGVGSFFTNFIEKRMGNPFVREVEWQNHIQAVESRAEELRTEWTMPLKSDERWKDPKHLSKLEASHSLKKPLNNYERIGIVAN